MKLVAGGKEFKTGKSKKDGSVGETIAIDGTPDAVQVGTSEAPAFFPRYPHTHTRAFRCSRCCVVACLMRVLAVSLSFARVASVCEAIED